MEIKWVELVDKGATVGVEKCRVKVGIDEKKENYLKVIFCSENIIENNYVNSK